MYKPVSLVEALEKRALFSVSLDSAGLLSITGTSAFDTLWFTRDDAQVVVTLNNVDTRFDAAAISRIDIDLGAAGDVITIDPRVIDVDTTVDATVSTGSSGDHVRVLGGPRSGALTLLGDNTDTLTVTLDGVTDIIRLGDGTIVREGAFSLDPALVHSGFGKLNIEGNEQQDVIVLEALTPTTLTVRTNGGNDTLTIGDSANGIDAPTGGLFFLDMGAGVDTLEIDDSLRTADHTYIHDGMEILRRTGGLEVIPLSYATLENLVIHAGTGSDTLQLEKVPYFSVSFDGNTSQDASSRDAVYVNEIDGNVQSFLPGAGPDGYEGYYQYVNGQRITFEHVEFRQVVSVYSGWVYMDADGSNWYSAGDPGIGGVTIRVVSTQADGSKLWTPVAVTDSNGYYRFKFVGTFELDIDPPEGYWVHGSNEPDDINFTPDGRVVSLGRRYKVTDVPPSYEYNGTFSWDMNRSWVFDAGDRVGANVEVWLDLDWDFVRDPGEPITTSDQNGDFKFIGLMPGVYQLRPDIPDTFERLYTRPIYIGSKGSIEEWHPLCPKIGPNQAWGLAFQTVFEGGDQGVHVLGGVTAYLDLNDDGTLDDGEPSMVTGEDGVYYFDNLAAGRYHARYIYPAGWQLSRPLEGHWFDKVDGVPVQLGWVEGAAVNVRSEVMARTFLDYNSNGKFDEGVDEWYWLTDAVWVDVNGNGLCDDYSVHGAGSYVEVIPGDYKLLTNFPAGWSATNLANGTWQTVTAAPGGKHEYMVGIRPSDANGSISGKVFYDNNRNGIQDPGEGPSAATLYLDKNGNRKLDYDERTLNVGPDGNYTFDFLRPGFYIIRKLADTSRDEPYDLVIGGTPFGDQWIYNLPTNAQVGGLNFALFYVSKNPGVAAGAISGRVYFDANKNGQIDDGEQGLAGRTVWDDKDNDKVLDPNELSAITDANGYYVIYGVSIGTHKIRMVLPLGWSQTSPSNGYGVNATLTGPGTILAPFHGAFSATGPGGSATAAGWMFFDDDKDGVEDASESRQPGKIVYIDANNNAKRDSGERQVTTNAQGEWSFTNLSPGTYIIRREVPTGYYVSTPVIQVTLAADQVAAGLKIGTAQGKAPTTPPPPPPTDPTDPVDPPPPPATGSIGGYLFWDANANTIEDTNESRQGGKSVYLDLNNNGQKDSNEPSVTTNANGEFAFTNLDPRTYVVRRTLGSGYWVTTPLIQVNLNGQSITNQKIGTAPGSGTQPPPVVDPTDPTDPVDPPPVDPPPVDPPPVGSKGSISGFLFNDTDGDGIVDSGEGRASGRVVYIDTNNNGKLDSGEKQTTTNTQGIYTFTDLDAGLYRVRRVFPKGYRQSTDVLDLNLAAGQVIDDARIGSTARVLVSGQVAHADTNSGIASRRVYVDTNGNGKFDSGEKNVFTDSGGAFAFFDLVAGTYKVRADLPAGWTSTNAAVVTLALSSGATHTTTRFSQRPIA